MIKLENQYILTINNKTIETDNPKQTLWNELFSSPNEKYEIEFIDAFLKEIKYELDVINELKDKSPEEVFFQFLSGSPDTRPFIAWVYVINTGLATRKDNKLFLTENGEDLLEVLEKIGIEGKKDPETPGGGEPNEPGTDNPGGETPGGTTDPENPGGTTNPDDTNRPEVGEGEVTPGEDDW